MIPFNIPYLTGKEKLYLEKALENGVLSGNNAYTKYCHKFLSERYGFSKVLLTTSCTDALEMAAILIDIKEGDEVILPSYTFVSTANAFVLRGAKIVYADSRSDHPGMDEDQIESLISSRTKAIVPVHYAGVACDMGKIKQIAKEHDVYVIEDAAQAIDARYEDSYLGGIGDIGCFSFHETKNISSGEGGALIVNNPELQARAEIIWEKGTNRAAFWRGEVDKYSWVDVGSSFLPSEMNAAYLAAQLDALDEIQNRRRAIWQSYHSAFENLEKVELISRPKLPSYAENNAHMYYLILNSLDQRTWFIEYLKANEVYAVFHYISLHTSVFGAQFDTNLKLDMAELYSDKLVRLPLYAGLKEGQVQKVIEAVISFFK